jgi:hypothetical protein
MTFYVCDMAHDSALQLYHQFVAIIDQAAQNQAIHDVPRAAEAANLSGGEEARALGQRWNYSFTDDERGKLVVHARWWDSSKAFSIRPDIHVMSAEWHKGSEKLSHERRYETP